MPNEQLPCMCSGKKIINKNEIIPENTMIELNLFFNFNETNLTEDNLQKLIELVNKLENIKIEVISVMGHTDNIGSDIVNLLISKKRASIVKEFLVSTNIEANLIFIEYKGKNDPIADNNTENGRAMNRRVEIKVIGKIKSDVNSENPHVKMQMKMKK
jgi:OOP family OmpA-OmpF porin